MLNDLQRASNVVAGGYEEYPLIDKTAIIRFVNRSPAVLKWAILLNEPLCDNTATDRNPMKLIRTETSGSAFLSTWRVTLSPRLIK